MYYNISLKNKIGILCSLWLVGSTTTFAITSESLQQQYNQVRDDLRLIKECYFKKLPTCTIEQQKKASQSLKRVMAEGALLIVTLMSLGYGVYRYNKNSLLREIRSIFPYVKSVEIKDEDLIIEFKEDRYIGTEERKKLFAVIDQQLLSKGKYLIRVVANYPGGQINQEIVEIEQMKVGMQALEKKYAAIPNNERFQVEARQDEIERRLYEIYKEDNKNRAQGNNREVATKLRVEAETLTKELHDLRTKYNLYS